MNDSPTQERGRVLVTDSEFVARDDLKGVLKDRGLIPEHVETGSKALEQFAQNRYDLVVTDIEIPGITGTSFLRELMEQNPFQAVIVVSADPQHKSTIRRFSDKSICFLQKPYEAESFRSTVQAILEHANRERSFVDFVEHESLTLKFRSKEYATGKVTTPLINKLYRTGVLDLNTKFEVDLAFQEAIRNSIDHGNLQLASEWKDQFNDDGIDLYELKRRERLADPDYGNRIVTVVTDYWPNRLRYRIKDQGDGFDVDGGKTEKPNLAQLLCHGRGMTIIYETMDEVQYRLGGSEITMVKYLSE